VVRRIIALHDSVFVQDPVVRIRVLTQEYLVFVVPLREIVPFVLALEFVTETVKVFPNGLDGSFCDGVVARARIRRDLFLEEARISLTKPRQAP